MTARQQRRHEERKARKEAYKAQKAAKTPEQPAAPSTETGIDRASVNRANAQHEVPSGSGPKTPEGKLASSRNSFKHGLYSKQLVLPGEDPTELDALRDDLRREHQPATPTEEILVNELAEHFWRLRRMRKYEARIMGSGSIEELHKGFAILPIVQRTMAAAERGFHKALTALQKLQKERTGRLMAVVRGPKSARAKNSEPAVVASDSEPPYGFVSQNPPQTIEQAPSAVPHLGFVSQNSLNIAAIHPEQHCLQAA